MFRLTVRVALRFTVYSFTREQDRTSGRRASTSVLCGEVEGHWPVVCGVQRRYPDCGDETKIEVRVCGAVENT